MIHLPQYNNHVYRRNSWDRMGLEDSFRLQDVQRLLRRCMYYVIQATLSWNMRFVIPNKSIYM
jgi:hypothetical protein